MMMKLSLDEEFLEAYDKLCNYKGGLAPDIMLKLYAYYKQATSGNYSNINKTPDVRDAFKFNAWMQLRGMTQDEAKEHYIELAKEILGQ